MLTLIGACTVSVCHSSCILWTHYCMVKPFWLNFRIIIAIISSVPISTFELSHEILALFVLRKSILQIHMLSHSVWLDVWFLVLLFVYFHSSCVRTVKALARLHGCTDSPEPSLVAYAISIIISWACSFFTLRHRMLYTKLTWSSIPLLQNVQDVSCICFYIFS